MMVEILPGAACCERVLVSRQIVLPKIEEASEGMCLMVINSTGGKQVKQTLEALIKEGVLKDGTFKEIDDNIYAVENFPDDGCAMSSLSITIKDQHVRVYFQEPSEVHENHFGRCTPDGFACGVHDSDVWHKLLDGKTPTNEFVLTRSYHMDCEPDWTYDDTSELLSSEQQSMLELGLPLSFGQAKSFNRLSDEAIVGELESQIVEKDYDKELADLSSSTERMSLSRSSRPESTDLFVRDDMCSSPNPPPSDPITADYTAGHDPTPPGSLTFEQFEEYWASNGQRVLEDEWRQRYGEYMMQPLTKPESEVASHSDDGISLEGGVTQLPTGEDNLYAGEWETLWVQLATDIYYALMNKLVLQDELAGISDPNGQNTSLKSNEGSVEQGDSEAGGGDQSSEKEEGDTSSNKRPLSVGDFGVSASDEGSCSIENRYIKNHRLKKIKRESHNHEKDPNEISADALEDGPKNAALAKYWHQRYRLFRKFDDGIQMDDEGWFSVTPEKIAEHIACRLCPRSTRKAMLTMDGFCGVGGNTIQLALRSPFVLAVDNNPDMIAMAKNNARVYGVDKKIEFVIASMEHFVPRIAPDSIFMSPPWGGPNYKNKPTFDLDDIAAVDIRGVFRMYQALSPNIALILPRNTKLDQLCELGKVEVEQNLLNKKIKTITAYYGNLICK